jgi:hypothetical protein
LPRRRRSKTPSIQHESAQYAESTLPSTSKKLFYQTWPGWTWSKYNARKLYGENRYIADMLPITSTFTGHLDSAEAIYEGPNQNLVGIKTFSGSAGNQSPQHAVLLGMSGAGKSVTICDLLSQTENYYAYTVIIEEGLSYGIYTQTVEPEAKPIVIQPDGDITINYLDTKGLPLTPDHLASATALVARMVGLSQSEDKQMLRQAQIAKYINQLYEDVFQDWSRKNEMQMMQVARHACALAHYRKEKMPPGATMLEAFADFRDHQTEPGTHAPAMLENQSSQWRKSIWQQFSEGEVLKFLKDPNTVKDVRNIAFAYLKTDEYPTHRMLQELMSLDASGAERDQIIEIATLLLPWCGTAIMAHCLMAQAICRLPGKSPTLNWATFPIQRRSCVRLPVFSLRTMPASISSRCPVPCANETSMRKWRVSSTFRAARKS